MEGAVDNDCSTVGKAVGLEVGEDDGCTDSDGRIDGCTEIEGADESEPVGAIVIGERVGECTGLVGSSTPSSAQI